MVGDRPLQILDDRTWNLAGGDLAGNLSSVVFCSPGRVRLARSLSVMGVVETVARTSSCDGQQRR